MRLLKQIALLLVVLHLAASFEFTSIEHSFVSKADNLTLYGTLKIPKIQDATVKIPAIVFVHGSGGNSRHESGAVGLWNTDAFPQWVTPHCGYTNVQFKTFDDIGDFLASQGVAVLSYDKRECCDAARYPQCKQCAPSAQGFQNCYYGCDPNHQPQQVDFNKLTLDTLIEDTVSGLESLKVYMNRSHANVTVDMTKLAVLGHSQGVNVVPFAAKLFNERYAAQHYHVKNVILFMGGARPIDETFVDQSYRNANRALQLKTACQKEDPTSPLIPVADNVYTESLTYAPIYKDAFQKLKDGRLPPSGPFCTGGCSTGYYWLSWIKYSSNETMREVLLKGLPTDEVRVLSINSPTDYNLQPVDYKPLLAILDERQAQGGNTETHVVENTMHYGIPADFSSTAVTTEILQILGKFLQVPSMVCPLDN